MAMHDLDPLHIDWDDGRIGGDPRATYEIPELSLFRPADLKRQYQRKIRQMRGRLENLAIRGIVYQHGYEGLPAWSDEMILSFVAQHGLPPASPVDRFFRRLALRQVRAANRPDPARLEPVLLRRLPGGSGA
jgi:hypothetical protein